MGAYPKIKILQIGESIKVLTNLGEEKYSDKDGRQIIVRKKKIPIPPQIGIYGGDLIFFTN